MLNHKPKPPPLIRPYRPFRTSERKLIRELYTEGNLSAERMADALGRSLSSLTNYLAKNPELQKFPRK